MNRRLNRLLLAAALGVTASMCLASSAGASFHLNLIRQVHPDNNVLGGDWVELQMYSSGENFVAGKVIRTFGPGGAENAKFVIPSNAPNGGNQRTILISSLFMPAGVNADFVAMPSRPDMTGQDGAVCFTNNDPPNYTPVDCVSYGNFTGSLPAGTPAVATPFGSTLERSITRGCPTALDAADDTNNSSA